MAHFDYLVVPAPRKGLKDKGTKGADARFAAAVATVLNRHAAEGWEYMRTDTLPSEERDGLMMNRVTVFQNLLVFRRPATPRAADGTTALIEDRSDDVAASAGAANPTSSDAKGDPA